MQQRLGATFAPPLTQALINQYGQMIDQLPLVSDLRDHLVRIYRCVSHWWTLPESTSTPTPHPIGIGQIIQLDDHVSEKMNAMIPSHAQLQSYGRAFEAIDADTQKALRDMAYHLLWHASELACGREPITLDKVQS